MRNRRRQVVRDTINIIYVYDGFGNRVMHLTSFHDESTVADIIESLDESSKKKFFLFPPPGKVHIKHRGIVLSKEVLLIDLFLDIRNCSGDDGVCSSGDSPCKIDLLIPSSIYHSKSMEIYLQRETKPLNQVSFGLENEKGCIYQNTSKKCSHKSQ